MEDRNNRVQDSLQQLQGVKIEALLAAYKLGSLYSVHRRTLVHGNLYMPDTTKVKIVAIEKKKIAQGTWVLVETKKASGYGSKKPTQPLMKARET